MARSKDITGLKMNRLEAIRPVYKQEGSNRWIWEFKCNCGNLIETRPSRVKSGDTKSCGCLQQEILANFNNNKPLLSREEIVYKRVIKDYKKKATQRGFVWELTKEECYILFQNSCFYCGAQPSNKGEIRPRYDEPLSYSGIDRIDNTQGYITGNVVSCCSKCNWGKKNYTKDEFFKWIESVYLHSLKGINNAPTDRT